MVQHQCEGFTYLAGRQNATPRPAPCLAQALLGSPLGLVQRLPCASAVPSHAAAQTQAPLRRAASMQALASGGAGGCVSPFSGGGRGDGACLPGPCLPTVQELEEGAGQACLLPVHRNDEAVPPPPLPAAAAPQHAGPPPRRCHSDTALIFLEQQQQLEQAAGCGRRLRPLWLAQQLQPAPEQRGWGVCSPARLQDLACRQLCASLAAEYARQHGGGRLPAGLAEAIEAELRWAAGLTSRWQHGH